MTANEYVCLSQNCQKQWEKKHIGGQLFNVGGAMITGALLLFGLPGGDGEGGGDA